MANFTNVALSDQPVALLVIDLCLRAIAAYLLGSVCAALLLDPSGDARKHGSGNAGATNVWRLGGFAAGLVVLAIDSAKGWLALWLIASIALPFGPSIGLPWRQGACVVAVVLGHLYPLYYGFRGGKGVATYLGALMALSPLVLVGPIAVFFAVFLTWGFMSAATLLAVVLTLPMVAILAESSQRLPWLAGTTLCALMIVYAHRSNLKLLWLGDEYCFERVRWRNWTGRGR